MYSGRFEVPQRTKLCVKSTAPEFYPFTHPQYCESLRFTSFRCIQWNSLACAHQGTNATVCFCDVKTTINIWLTAARLISLCIIERTICIDYQLDIEGALINVSFRSNYVVEQLSHQSSKTILDFFCTHLQLLSRFVRWPLSIF